MVEQVAGECRLYLAGEGVKLAMITFNDAASLASRTWIPLSHEFCNNDLRAFVFIQVAICKFATAVEQKLEPIRCNSGLIRPSCCC